MSDAPAAGRASAALGIGALAGALAAVPAVVRVASAGAGAGTAALALYGGSALVLGPLLVLLERAHAGGARWSVAIAGLGLAAWPVARFGAVLQATTNHRPLGAATFVVGALVIVLGCLLVARRVAAVGARSSGRAASLVLYTAAALSTGLVMLAALRAEVVRPHALDAVLLVVGGALGWVGLRRQVLARPLSRFGLVLWTTLVAGHLFAVTRPAFDQIRDRAPVLCGPAAWL